ncbi:SHOCT domain-containing protein [Chloroflexota bacterium]
MAGGIGQGIVLAITIPIGVIGCIVFLFLAYKNRNEQSIAEKVASDIPAQIRELVKLRDDGILSQEEFESKKTDLLSRM